MFWLLNEFLDGNFHSTLGKQLGPGKKVLNWISIFPSLSLSESCHFRLLSRLWLPSVQGHWKSFVDDDNFFFFSPSFRCFWLQWQRSYLRWCLHRLLMHKTKKKSCEKGLQSINCCLNFCSASVVLKIGKQQFIVVSLDTDVKVHLHFRRANFDIQQQAETSIARRPFSSTKQNQLSCITEPSSRTSSECCHTITLNSSPSLPPTVQHVFLF